MIGAIRAGQAFVELALKKDPLERGLRAAEARLRAWGAQVRSVGSSFLQAGLAIGAPLALAGKIFADFEQSMAKVKAVTNGITNEEFKALNDEAKRLGATTSFSAKQAADAMVVFALAGLRAGETIKATGPALNLAAAGQVEIAEAADIALTVMKQFGFTVEQLPALLDVMGKAMSTANTDIRLLGEGFKKVGLTANAAGQDIYEVTAALQILSDAGSKGEEGGTALRGIYAALTNQTAEAAAELQKLGVSIKAPNGEVKQLTQIVEELAAAYDKVRAAPGGGGFDVLRSLGQIFTVRTAGAAVALISKVKELKGLAASNRDSRGTLEKQAATQLDTLRGSFLLLMSALEGLAITIGSAITPLVREIGETMATVSGAVSKWAEANPRLFQTLVQVTVGLGVAGAALTAAGIAAGVASFAIGGFAAMIGAAKWALLIFLNPAFVALRWAVTFGVALAKTTETGREAWASMASAAVRAFDYLRAGWDVVRGDIVTGWQGMADALANGDLEAAASIAWDSVRLVVARAVDYVSGLSETVWDAFMSAHYRMAETALGAHVDLWASLQSGWVDLTSSLQSTWVEFSEWLTGDWQGTVIAFAEGWDYLSTAAALAWEAATTPIVEGWKYLSEVATLAWEAATAAFEQFIEYVKPALYPIYRLFEEMIVAAQQLARLTGFDATWDTLSGPASEGAGGGSGGSRNNRLEAVESERNSRRDAIEERRRAWREGLAAAREAANEERRGAADAANLKRDAAIAALEASIKDRAEWQAIVRELDRLDREAEAEYNRNVPLPGLGKRVEEIGKQGLGPAVGSSIALTSAAVLGLQRSDQLGNRTAKAAEETAKNTGRMAALLEGGGLAFG